jgi:hypothetical protein
MPEEEGRGTSGGGRQRDGGVLRLERGESRDLFSLDSVLNSNKVNKEYLTRHQFFFRDHG